MRRFSMFDLEADTEGLGRTDEEVVFEPEDEKIKDAPVVTDPDGNGSQGAETGEDPSGADNEMRYRRMEIDTAAGDTTTEVIFDPDDVKITEEKDGSVGKNDSVHEKADKFAEDQGEQSFGDEIVKDEPTTVTLIPELEAFMTDTNVDINVQVSDEPESEAAASADTAAEAEEATGDEEEVQDVDNEVSEETAETEMILQRFGQIRALRHHVKTMGVDREFLRMCNQYKELDRLLHMTFPAFESFDVAGDPSSAYSVAALAGFDDVLKKAGNFFSRFGKKTGILMDQLTEATRQRWSSLESNIYRLRVTLQETKDFPERAKESGSEVWSMESFSQVYKDLSGNFGARLESAVNALPAIVEAAKSQNVNKAADHTTKIMQILTDIEKANKQFEMTKKSMSKVPLGNISRNDCVKLLDLAGKMKMDINRTMDIAKSIKSSSATFAVNAAMISGTDIGDHVASLFNKSRKLASSLTKNQLWLVQQMVRTAGQRISVGSRKD